MGVVYRAVRDDDAFRKIVALKLVHSGGSVLLERRLRQERQILGRLQHANIATIFDGGATEEGRPYFVMEYVEGKPITEHCNAAGLDTRQRLEIFRTVCEAVHHAHQNMVVHRDLKPANILVTTDGSPKLLDFGIAKLLEAIDPHTAPTATMSPAMTPEYTSPELVKGETVTAASDVYSLGVVLYELLTGRRPYEVMPDSLEAIVRVVCDTDPPAPSAVARSEGQAWARSASSSASELRGDLDTIVLKALRKKAHQRYASVDQLSEDVRRHLEGLPIIARRDTLAYRAAKFLKRNKAAGRPAYSRSGTITCALADTWWLSSERGWRYRPALDRHGLHRSEPRRRRGRMAAKLAFQYDREADILHISNRPPYAEQETEELGDDVLARINPETGEVESLEVLFFSTRLLRSDLFELPVTADLHRVG